MRIYSPEKRALIYIEKKATPGFWDAHWNSENLRQDIVACTDSWYASYLKKYLPGEKGIILEGGCGKGQQVYSFKCQGYNAVGIDFAEKTVNAINELVPEIDVRFGDVRRLPFEDGEIAGYWSIGVIEHFWEGYAEIINEMKRVIRPGGYLFLTFPYMSPLRKLKANLGLYTEEINGNLTEDFYQFALDHKAVISNLEKRGFYLKEEVGFDSIKGLKDEVKLLNKPLQKLYDYRGTKSYIYRMKNCLDKLFLPFASHCILLVLQKD